MTLPHFTHAAAPLTDTLAAMSRRHNQPGGIRLTPHRGRLSRHRDNFPTHPHARDCRPSYRQAARHFQNLALQRRTRLLPAKSKPDTDTNKAALRILENLLTR